MVFGFTVLFVGFHRSTWGNVFWVFTEKPVTDKPVAEKPGTEKPVTKNLELKNVELKTLCYVGFRLWLLTRQLKILSLKNP